MTRAEELRLANALAEELKTHLLVCDKHRDAMLVPMGLFGLSAALKFFLCRWCEAHEPFESEDLCAITTQSDRFARKHIHCRPDPRFRRIARVKKLFFEQGWQIFRDNVRLGDRYVVYTNTIRSIKSTNMDAPNTIVDRPYIWAEAKRDRHAGWLPVEAFDIKGEKTV